MFLLDPLSTEWHQYLLRKTKEAGLVEVSRNENEIIYEFDQNGIKQKVKHRLMFKFSLF
jgi:predicted MarR family transcription regulator